uniref:Uncharacterized protein n=1 Tax=Megaselia scalaris TaxID=36166 RepID=T1GSG9_MEGSC
MSVKFLYKLHLSSFKKAMLAINLNKFSQGVPFFPMYSAPLEGAKRPKTWPATAEVVSFKREFPPTRLYHCHY